MKHQSEVSKTSVGDANLIWRTVASCGGLELWMPSLVRSCALTGTGPGAKRIVTLADGGELTERIVEIDETARRFRYAIDEHPFPFSDAVGTISVETTGPTAFRLTWRSDFEIEESLAPTVEAMMTAFYSTAIDSLLAYCADASTKEEQA